MNIAFPAAEASAIMTLIEDNLNRGEYYGRRDQWEDRLTRIMLKFSAALEER